MKFKTWTRIIALALFAATAIPVQLAAQEQQRAPVKQPFQRYAVTDLGTLGGTFSFGVGINNEGWVAGLSTLPGDLNQHAFVWRNGKITDLGTLGGPNSAPSFSPFSERGDLGGEAETSTPDPNGEDFCGHGTGLICLPVLWHDGITAVLPTLGGNNGVANQVNNRGQVAGAAESTTLVPPCLQGLAEPVVWDNGVIEDLHVFPGDSAGVALAINDSGEAVGFSASCTAFHALLWRNGAVTDLGNLGGIAGNVASAINNRGQIAGSSDLPGDTISHAFLWKNGVMTDLGTLPGDLSSGAIGINSKTQVVGASSDTNGNTRAFLWEQGAMIDLNSLLPAGSPWFLTEADSINSRGQIVGGAFNVITGDVHAVLTTPCDEANAQDDGCKDIETATTRSETSETPKLVLPENARRMLQQRPGSRYLITGLRPSK
jgi:probable HAF family extracellular repeat protein